MVPSLLNKGELFYFTIWLGGERAELLYLGGGSVPAVRRHAPHVVRPLRAPVAPGRPVLGGGRGGRVAVQLARQAPLQLLVPVHPAEPHQHLSGATE